MTLEELEREIQHLASKEDVAKVSESFHKELHGLTWRLITVIISMQVPTWIGIIGILLKK